MKRTTFFSSLLVAALGIVMLATANTTSPARAGACTFTWVGGAIGNPDAWRVAINWSDACGDHDWPVAGDTAIIPDAATTSNDPLIDDQDETVTTLTINRGGLLKITGKTLTLDGTAQHDIDGNIELKFHASVDSVLKVTGAVTMDIDGQILLEADNSVLDFEEDVTVSGAGSIIGQHNSAKIQILGAKKLTSSMLLVGQMTLETDGGSGNGTFLNGSTGIVRANAAGTLKLASGLTLDDDSGASWEAITDGSAFLRFDEDATTLVGIFVLCSDATIQFGSGVDIDTEGCFDTDGDAANGDFDFLGTGSFHTDDIDCNSGGGFTWTVDTTFSGTCAD